MKKLKIIGNIATVLAMLLIIRRILRYDINWRELLTADKIWILFLSIAAYTLIVFLNHIPWMELVKLFSGRKKALNPSRGEFVDVYTKANVFKYIPGNVFQYVGRNEIAFRLGLNHADVASSTILEIVLTVVAAVLSAFVLIGSYALSYFSEHWIILLAILCTGLMIFAVLVFLARKKQGKLKEYLVRYKETLSDRRAVWCIIGCTLFYAFTLFYSGGVFYVVLRLCGGIGITAGGVRIVLGAYILAWVAGYITPGSPGGIGIRELIMLSVIVGSGVIPETAVTSASVIFRIVTILGDVLAFCFVLLWKRISQSRQLSKMR